MKTLRDSIKLWKGSVAGTRWPMFWLLSRPLFALVPYLTIAFVFFESGSGLFFIFLVSLSGTLTYFLRNCFRVEKLILRSGTITQKSNQEHLYNVLFFRSVIEFVSPLVILYVFILRHDVINLATWLVITLVELGFLLFLARSLVPAVIYFLSKWQDTRHFLRYLNAIIMVSVLACFQLARDQEFFVFAIAVIPIVSFSFLPTLLYVEIPTNILILSFLLKVFFSIIIFALSKYFANRVLIENRVEFEDEELI